jgi:uncharacterized protein YecE (DUF72 family)
MGDLLLGCSGWNYPDTSDRGGWTGVFYPDKDTKEYAMSTHGLVKSSSV